MADGAQVGQATACLRVHIILYWYTNSDHPDNGTMSHVHSQSHIAQLEKFREFCTRALQAGRPRRLRFRSERGTPAFLIRSAELFGDEVSIIHLAFATVVADTDNLAYHEMRLNTRERATAL
jgi:hypothetical protein